MTPPWIADQIVDDLNMLGMGKHRIIVKTDQEEAMKALPNPPCGDVEQPTLLWESSSYRPA